MSGIGETISANLSRHFERKLTQVSGDLLRCEPEGYRSEYDARAQRCVLRHMATGIRVGANCLDLVERVDRSKPVEKTLVVYCYLPAAVGGRDAFSEVERLANRQPRDAFQALVTCGALSRVGETVHADFVEEELEEEEEWYGGNAVTLDPADVGRWLSRGAVVRDHEPWCGAEFCVALFVSASRCRPAAGRDYGIGEVVEILSPGTPPGRASAMAGDGVPQAAELQVDHSIRLIEHASHRDVAGVMSCLDARADPLARDTRGWTALHAASQTRPCWEILEVLIPVSDLCARNNAGKLPVNIADEARQDDTAEALREVMRRDKKGKHLILS